MSKVFIEEFKKDLNKLFSLSEKDEEVNDIPKNNEEELADELSNDVKSDQDTKNTDDNEVDNTDTDNDANKDINDLQNDLNKGSSSVTPSSSVDSKVVVPGTGDTVNSPEVADTMDDKSIEKSMFSETNNPETDYGLTNPNNIRLFKFKFKNAGIELESIMNEVERKSGVMYDTLVSRLTPEQQGEFAKKNTKMREEFPLINKREKRIVLFNARIPMFYFNENSNKIEKIKEDNVELIKQAFDKIDEYLERRYGLDWIDNLDAVKYLQEIKINFYDNKHKVTPNLINLNEIEEVTDIIPFNKIRATTPETVENYLKTNKDNSNLLNSSIFRTIASQYLDTATDSNSVYPLLAISQEENMDVTSDDTNNEAEQEDDEELETDTEENPEDFEEIDLEV